MSTKFLNPIASTTEYKSLAKTYKETLLKYQPGDWYFGMIDRGEKFDEETNQWGAMMTIEDLKERIRKISPIGPEVPTDEIEDVTGSVTKMFYSGSNYGAESYKKMQDWLNEQEDIFVYSRGNEEYNPYEALKIASRLGYKKLFKENLS